MGVLLLVGVVSAVFVLYVGERLLKARARGLRRQVMSDRLVAAASKAERQHQKRQAARKASEALTSFMPAINQPPLSVPGSERPRPGAEHAEQEEAGSGRRHFGRRGARSGEHPVRSWTGPLAAISAARRPRPAAPDADAAAQHADTGPQQVDAGAQQADAGAQQADTGADAQQ
jgi:hypothetical protein